MHARVATVHTPELDAARKAIATTDAELIEVRLDALWPTPPSEGAATDALVALTDAASAADAHLLATLRPTRQGGEFDGPEEVRLGLLIAAGKAGFDVADLECDHADNDATVAAFKQHEVPTFVSDHSLTDAPTRDAGLLRLLAMYDLGTQMEKLAFPCGSFIDALRALELTHAHGARKGRPAIAPIGGGPALRALLAVAGNRASYGHADGLPPAVPGQPALSDVARILDHWGLTPDDLGRPDGPPWLAVVGDPIDHSLSPAIHNPALRAAGRPERYGALQVPDSLGAFRLLCGAAGRIGLAGVSVTAPLKHHAHAVVQNDAVSEAVGAVNCIRFGEIPEGTNTDATALRRLLTPVADGRVAVIGAGGAARAAIWAAQQVGAQITFTSRDPARAEEVATETGATWVPWDQRDTLRADAWVQATPVGGPDETPIDAAALTGASLAIEMVYAGGATSFETAAADAGARVHTGKDVLVEQAIDAFTFWTGSAPDAAIMREAVA